MRGGELCTKEGRTHVILSVHEKRWEWTFCCGGKAEKGCGRKILQGGWMCRSKFVDVEKLKYIQYIWHFKNQKGENINVRNIDWD